MTTISMMEAYMIEQLKQKNYTYEQIISGFKADVISKEREALQQLLDSEDNRFYEAFHSGYRVSFVTRNGLKNLLKLKWNLDETMYRSEEFGVYDLVIDVATEQEIKSFLSSNWAIARTANSVSIFAKGL